jgi:hypothetical protein
LPVFLIIAFLSALALALHAAGAAFDGLAAGLAALPQEPTAPPLTVAQPPVVDPGPPPSAVQGETYAEFFARTGYLLKGPDDHEISGFHVFNGLVWVPATA